jgi:hypothetical protein
MSTPTVEELIVEQSQNEQEIRDFIKNLKKTQKKLRTSGFCAKQLTKINKLWKKYKEKYNEVYALAEQNEELEMEYFASDHLSVVEEVFQSGIIVIQDFLTAATADETDSEAENGSGDDADPDPKGFKGLKLEALQIKHFSGAKPSEWHTFSNLFMSIVKSNKLHKVTKFQYLLQNVEGSARDLISHIAMSSHAFKESWDILEETYNNERAIIDSEVNSLVYHSKIAPNCHSSLLQLRTKVREFLANLRVYGVETDKWDAILVPILTRKLDKGTLDDFEDKLDDPKKMPSLLQLTTAMDRRLVKLASGASSYNAYQQKAIISSPQNQTVQKHFKNGSQNQNNSQKGSNLKCVFCDGNHFSLACNNFQKASNDERHRMLFNKQLCLQCATHQHIKGVKCPKKQQLDCEVCHKKHASALHYCQFPSKNIRSGAAQNNAHVGNAQSTSGQLTIQAASPSRNEPTHKCVENSNISAGLLPTAIVSVEQGHKCGTARIVLDQGSSKSYISKQFANKLGLKIVKSSESFNMIGLRKVHLGVAELQTTFTLRSLRDTNEEVQITAFLVDGDPAHLPNVDLPENVFNKLRELPLADENLHRPCGVKILIGGKYYNKILSNKNLPIDFDDLRAQNSLFGYVIAGEVQNTKAKYLNSHVIANEANELEEKMVVSKFFENRVATQSNEVEQNLTQKIENFWELPETLFDDHLIDREGVLKQSLEQYDSKYFKDVTGRLHVPYIFERDRAELGESYKLAFRIYMTQEKRLIQDEEKYFHVQEFMKAYRDKGHMIKVQEGPLKVRDGSIFYVPHHTVMRVGSLTTKYRQVFNFSAKTSSGVDFNSIVSSGPNLLPKVQNILFSFRQYAYGFTSDVEMMYRQLFLIPEHQDLVRILWRENVYEPVQEWSLKTVSYGCACAPFQAVYSLHKIADNASNTEAAFHLKNSFYVDDLCAGAHEKPVAKNLASEINSEMLSSQMPLAKWAANDPEILSEIPTEKLINNYQSEDEAVKILGVLWDTKEDQLLIKTDNEVDEDSPLSMRDTLSKNSELWDPLNLLLPVIMLLRMLMQKVHELRIDWDDQITNDLKLKFIKIYKSLPILANISVPRWIGFGLDSVNELICFSDASKNGYAAVIYARVFRENKFHVVLVGARGRVSPIKSPASIPRLELEGVVLLYELLKDVLSTVRGVSVSKIRVFCDSEIVCCWIRHVKQSTKKIIKKRVQAISSLINADNINWVPSEQNPSDIASRGATPEALRQSEIWFEGPKWLKDYKLPSFRASEECSHENLPDAVTLNVNCEKKSSEMLEWFSKFSSWQMVLHITAFMLKFRYCQKLQLRNKGVMLPSLILGMAHITLIKLQQAFSFEKELHDLKNKVKINCKSALYYLKPFIDEMGALRVGGRLANASVLTYSERHPLILPQNSHITDIIIANAHKISAHATLGILLRHLRSNYFIIGLRKQCKKVINNCVICKRHAGRTVQPTMGSLPLSRITPTYQWDTTGCDLCGPFETKATRLRKAPILKVWVVLFIDFFSRAIHLECCTDLTKEAFLDALARFISRRSKPTTLVSDNGTNFRGSIKVLKKLQRMSADSCAEQMIDWKFNPVAGSHFGGLFERGVRSFKQILFKICSPSNLRYEEFLSIVIRTEGLLNSRPLFKLSENNDDEIAITPFHFMAHRALVLLPSIDYSNSTVPLSKRWALVDSYVHKIWNLWKDEWLLTMHKAQKWIADSKNLKVGDVVLIRNENTKPATWPMGRVQKVHADSKGCVRVVDVKERNKIKARPVNKLVHLLSDENAANNSRRTSPRNLAAATLFALALTTASLPLINTLTVTELKADLFVAREFQVAVQRGTWELEIDTKLNITEDSMRLNLLLRKLDEKCSLSVNFDCKSLVKMLEKDGDEVKGSIRVKRVEPFTVVAIGAGIASTIAIAGVSWSAVQHLQIRELNDQLKKANAEVATMLKSMYSISENQRNLMGNLVSVQESQDILLTITAIKDFIEELRLKYENARTLPSETNEKIRAKRAMLKNRRLPIGSNEEISNLISPSLIRTDYSLAITYYIPLIDINDYHKYRIIAFPDKNGSILALENEIVMNERNTTYFIPRLNKVIQSKHEIIYIDPLERKLEKNECLKEVMSSQKSHEDCNKEQMLDLNENWETLNTKSLIFDNVKKFSIDCNDKTETYRISRGIVVLDDNCSLYSQAISYTSPEKMHSVMINKHWTFVPILPADSKKFNEIVPITFGDAFDLSSEGRMSIGVKIALLTFFFIMGIAVTVGIFWLVIYLVKSLKNSYSLRFQNENISEAKIETLNKNSEQESIYADVKSNKGEDERVANVDEVAKEAMKQRPVEELLAKSKPIRKAN